MLTCENPLVKVPKFFRFYFEKNRKFIGFRKTRYYHIFPKTHKVLKNRHLYAYMRIEINLAWFCSIIYKRRKMSTETKSRLKKRISRIEERILRGRENLGQVIEIGFIDEPISRETFLSRFPLPGQKQANVFLIRESPEENIYFIFVGDGIEETFYALTEHPNNTIFLYGNGNNSLKTAYLSDSLILANNNGEIVRERQLGLCLS